ncbi:hypothetical protein CHS0354_012455 [Potamilus streckersoni]|uniref:C2H2-type domain-containing protein n=1 Tax=Potamilus streckersoni TaxID=2493646 RepID=A0AAE0VKC4_9BIVA|nr:hypothetical protein CHS0354_012455 [Potamilus streckersoni]
MSTCDSNDLDRVMPAVNTLSSDNIPATSLQNDDLQEPTAYFQKTLAADMTDQEKQPVIDATVQEEKSQVVAAQHDTSLAAQAKISKTDLKEATSVDGICSVFSSETPLPKADQRNIKNVTEIDGNIDKSSHGNEVEKEHNLFVSGRDNSKASDVLNAEDINKNAFAASASSQMGSIDKNDVINLKMLPESIQITDFIIVPGVADSMDLRTSFENMSSSTQDQLGDKPLEKAIFDHNKAETQMSSSVTSENVTVADEIRSCIPSDKLDSSSLLDKKTVGLSQPETMLILNDSHNNIFPQKSCNEIISSETPSRISTENEAATNAAVCDTSKNEKTHLANSELQTSDEVLKSDSSHNATECETAIDNFQSLTSAENMLMITDVRSISNENMEFGPDNSDAHVIKDIIEESPIPNTLDTSPSLSNMNTSDVSAISLRADYMKDKSRSESTTCTADSHDEHGVKKKDSHMLVSLLSNTSEMNTVVHKNSATRGEQSRLEGTLLVSSSTKNRSILHKRIEQVDPVPQVNQAAIKQEPQDIYETPTDTQPSMSYADRLKNIVDGCVIGKESTSRAGAAPSVFIARNTQNKKIVQGHGRSEETGQLQSKKDDKLSDGVKISVVTVGNCVNAPSSNSGAKPFLVVKNKTQSIGSTLKSTAGSNGSSIIPVSTQVLPIQLTPNTSSTVLKNVPSSPNIRYLVPMNLIPTSLNQSGLNSTSSSLPRSIQIRVTTSKSTASVSSNVSSIPVAVGTNTTNTITAVHNDSKLNPLKSPAITTISTLSIQNKATHNTKNMPPLGAGTINIDSVGVSKITELISRKNPIAIFKPPPIPSHLKTLFGENGKLHVCYECGDTFYFVDSLKQHQHRYSMKIRYKCETCNCFLIFYNKCQLLNHLRSHLNISKHMAVPIHIKSDSIQITTILSELGTDKPLQWFKEDPANLKLLCIDEKSTENVPSSNTKDTASISTEHCDTEKQTQQPAVKKLQITVLKPESLFSCSECKQDFPDKIELQHHLQKLKSLTPCSRCDMFLPTVCAALSHAMLHTPHEVGWKACPECGMQFRDNDQKFFYHLKYECLHLSRIVNFPCSKCLFVNDSCTELKTHLMKRLVQYYKCGNCQLAFKNLKLCESHLVSEHAHLKRVKPKILYRCHACNTLYDDKDFLDDDIEKHVKQAATQKKFVWRCTECLKVFQKKKGLEKHLKEKLTDDLSKEPFNCKPCNLRFIRFDQAFTHWLTFHVRNSTYEVRFCQLCGLICQNASALATHTCVDYVHIENSDKAEADKGNQVIEQQGNTNNITSVYMMTCCHCGLSCKSAASFAMHVRKHVEVDVFICKHCGKKNYNSYADLRNHEVVCGYLQKRPIVSTENQKQPKKRKISMSPCKFPKKLAKLDTAGAAREQQVFMCEKCSMTFLWQDDFDLHNKSEHGIHPCHLCGLTYESQNILQKHIKTSHEGKKHVYPCWVCRKRKIKKFFSDRTRLEKHLAGKHRVHPDESMLVPEYPGLEEVVHSKSDSQKRKLNSSGDSPVKKLRVAGDGHFSCAKCTFSCTDRSEFLSHIKEHSVEKSVQCVECGLSFMVIPSLKKHLFMVHKVRDYEAYFKENNLLHLMQENEDMDIDKKNLNTNMEAEKEKKVKVEKEEDVNGNPLECNVCYKVFPNEAAIKSHMRVHGMAFIKAKRRALSSKGLELNQSSSPSSDGSGKEEEKATFPESKTAGNRAGTVEK